MLGGIEYEDAVLGSRNEIHVFSACGMCNGGGVSACVGGNCLSIGVGGDDFGTSVSVSSVVDGCGLNTNTGMALVLVLVLVRCV